MTALKSQTFNKPLLLLCEGDSDRRFFQKLIASRNIRQNFDIRFPGRNDKDTGGRGKFGTWLDGASAGETFRGIKGVLIVSDNDEDCSASFKEVQREAGKVRGCPIPQTEQKIVRSKSFPAIAILMIPIGQRGNLETLCLPAANHKWNLQKAINTLVAASPASQWKLGKQSKAKLQATLAMTCKSNPCTTFSYHWDENDDYCIPLDHSCFDSVEAFLRTFEAQILDT